MHACVWRTDDIKRVLSANYNGALMRVNPQEYADRREVPKYGIPEVALYLSLKQSTLRDWFFGRTRTMRDGRVVEYPRLAIPALHNPYGPALSFYNLAEAQV